MKVDRVQAARFAAFAAVRFMARPHLNTQANIIQHFARIECIEQFGLEIDVSEGRGIRLYVSELALRVAEVQTIEPLVLLFVCQTPAEKLVFEADLQPPGAIGPGP